LILIGVDEVEKAGMAPFGLGDARQPQAGKAQIQDPVDVGQVIGQADESQLRDDLFAQQGAVARVVVVRDPEPGLIDHGRA
jgi:hypothetical protein